MFSHNEKYYKCTFVFWCLIWFIRNWWIFRFFLYSEIYTFDSDLMVFNKITVLLNQSDLKIKNNNINPILSCI